MVRIGKTLAHIRTPPPLLKAPRTYRASGDHRASADFIEGHLTTMCVTRSRSVSTSRCARSAGGGLSLRLAACAAYFLTSRWQ